MRCVVDLLVGGLNDWLNGHVLCLSIRAYIPHPTEHKTQYFAREKDRLLTEVDAKGSELSHALTTFQEAFDAERRERLEREGRILRQLGEHEQEVARRFEAERVGGWVGFDGVWGLVSLISSTPPPELTHVHNTKSQNTIAHVDVPGGEAGGGAGRAGGVHAGAHAGGRAVPGLRLGGAGAVEGGGGAVRVDSVCVVWRDWRVGYTGG